MLNLPHIADWLKTSIVGIILLGAVGSILAVIILNGLKWFAKRYIIEWLLRYVSQYARSYVSAVILTRRFVKHKQFEKLIFQCVFAIGEAFFSGSIFLVLFIASCGAIYRAHLNHVPISNIDIGLIVAALVFLHLCLKDVNFIAGMYFVLMADDLKEVESLLKKSKSLASILKLTDGGSSDQSLG
jgi:hypothetical protein